MKFCIRDIVLGRSRGRGRGRGRGSGSGSSSSSSSPSRSGSPSRIYGPTDLEDRFDIEEVKDVFKPVVAKIRKLYGKAEGPAIQIGFGFCFGLLDPISNIVVNRNLSFPRWRVEGESYEPPEGVRNEEQAADMATRSLNGLVAFLTCLFPYLPEREALGYLDSARADLIVACLLIIRRRGMREFNPCSVTAMAAIETALKCAAIAAQHPDPQQFVLGWKLLSPHLAEFPFKYDRRAETRSVTRSVLQRALSDIINGARTSSDLCIIMEKSWNFASLRLDGIQYKELPPARAAMKRMLLATIHEFYLQALAMLPTAELCTRYHRSMVMGGYCYGPLDPVSNIIVNTIWYEQRFPLNKDLITLHMISTKGLWRIAARSLYGLVSFLCTRYPALTPDLAMQRLLVAKADLRAADPNLGPIVAGGHMVPDLDWSGCYQVGSGTKCARELQHGAVDSQIPSASAEEAYAAAARAVLHQDPSAQKELLGSPSARTMLLVASERLEGLHDDHVLSVQDVSFLSQLFRCPPWINELDKQQLPARRRKMLYTFMSNCSDSFWDQHDRVCSMVEAALDAFNEGKELKYSVHVICGVNELVSGPEFCKDAEIRGYNPWTPFKYHHSHINFLATCGESKPTLFFAECSNHGTDEAWCIPVEPLHPVAEYVRCIYCEYEGNRIVHPTVKGFHGRDKEFVKLLRGEALFLGTDKDLYRNNRIITDKQEEVDWVHSVSDDYIYSVNYADGAPDDGDGSDGDDDYSNDGRMYLQFD